jgi:hypothetical protein
MKETTISKLQKALLLIVAIGLIPIALSYGLIPKRTLSFLYDISSYEINQIHILRAVMGLYLAFVIFWFIGAFKVKFRQAALYCLVVFMFGLAAGRILSLMIEGVPNWLLLVYLLLEKGFGIIGLVLIRKSSDS